MAVAAARQPKGRVELWQDAAEAGNAARSRLALAAAHSRRLATCHDMQPSSNESAQTMHGQIKYVNR